MGGNNNIEVENNDSFEMLYSSSYKEDKTYDKASPDLSRKVEIIGSSLRS